MRVRWVSLIALCVLAFARAGAQLTLPSRIGPPPGVAASHIMSGAAVAESLAVLKQLEKYELGHEQDGAAWYRSGMVAWGLMFQSRMGPPDSRIDWTKLGRLADTALRIALQIEKHDPRTVLSVGQFFLGTGPITVRAQSYHLFQRAYDLTKGAGQGDLHAEAAIELGRVYWRRYDGLANRRVATGETDVLRSLASMHDQQTDAMSRTSMPIRPQDVLVKVNSATEPLPADLNGIGDYLRAEEFFRDAYASAPSDDRVFHELAMLYADHGRWAELGGFSRDRIRRTPRAPQPWLTLGLALQRQRKPEAASAAFDTALSVMDPRERSYLTRLQRVMSPRDTMGFAAMSPDERATREREYWLFVDPLWSHGGNYAFTEFLARVTYADLRWSVEELGQRGLDSDRGDIHVRYGPPTLEAVLGPAPMRGDLGASLSADGGYGGFAGMPVPLTFTNDQDEVLRRSSVATIWAYDVGWMIIFRGAPTYGTARIAPEDLAMVDSLVDASPSLWKNVPDETIRPMPTQVARFRAPGDSVDVVIATDPPVDDLRMLAGSNAQIRADLWLFGRDRPLAIRDSVALSDAGPRTWKYRLPPAQVGYRIETTAPGALLAGRNTDWIDASTNKLTGFESRGFGISDILLAQSVTEQRAAKRWSDLEIGPTGGSVAQGAQIALVWENYDLAARDGNAAYGVTITLERQYKMLLNRIRTRVVGSLAAMVGVDRTEDRLVFRYDRAAAASATVVDHLTIGLEDAPAGVYLLTLDVTDRVTGKTASRTQMFTVRDR